MYFNLVVVLLILFLVFLILQEYFDYIPDKDYTVPLMTETNETFKTKKPKYTTDIEPEELTYKTQYKNTIPLNREMDCSNVFYEEMIKKPLNIKNENIFSITQELTPHEMNSYLNIVKNKNNEQIIGANNNKKVFNFFKNVDVKDWDEKILLKENEYILKKEQVSKEELKKFINGSNLTNYIKFTIINFIADMNTHFEDTDYFEKYNKHHPFDSYILMNHKIRNFFLYTIQDDSNNLMQRAIITLKIHRPNKIYDFIVLLDVFFMKKDANKNIEDLDIDNFKDYYHIFIKHARVIGTPFPHNTRKLEEDDTDFILNQNNFSVLTNEMMEDMDKIDKLISKEKEIRKLNPVELGYQDIFEEIQEINQNKIFNGIIFKQLLLKIQKVAEEGENNNKLGNTKIVKAYEPLIEKFIIHCQLVLQNQNTQKTDLSKDIKFNEQDLIQSPLLTPDLEKMLETLKAKNKKNKKSFTQIVGDRLRERTSNYRCYNPKQEDAILDMYTTRPSCISYHEEIGVSGVWDKQCETNDDCPFYQANTNYPNDFGGCNNGKCEMPVGMSVIGGTKVSRIGSPYCYNCDRVGSEGSTFQERGRCCSEQLKDKTLESPDFMYEGDKQFRFKHRSYLEDNNLKP